MSGVFVFRQPPQGFHTEYFGGGGGKGGSSVQTMQVPPEVMARYNAVNARAEAVASKPFQRYGGEFVAPINAQQQTGIAGINAAANMAQPYYADAMKGLTSAQALSDKYLKNATSETYAAKNVGQGYADTAGEYYTGAEGAASPYYDYAATNTEGAVAGAQPYMDAATLAAMYGAAGVNPQELQTERYMNPYVQNVVNTTQAALNQKFGQQNAQQQSEAIKAGAFGGDRAGIARGVLRGQQGLTMAEAISPLYKDAYNNALKTAGEQQGVYLSAGQKNREAIQKASDQISALGKQGYDMRSGAALQMQGIGKDIYNQRTTTGEKVAALGAQQFGQGNKTAEQIASQGKQGYDTGASTAKTTADVGTAAQKAGLEGAQAQIAAGTLEQQTKQAEDTARYQQHLQEQGYDFQTAKFLADIALGTGTASGNTTTSDSSGGFFSDKRLKEDVKEIGKTNDGQPIYSYKYKGDDRTQIGLMAQDVEKRHPEAVGLTSGYKTVNYKKATEDSERPARAYGGGLDVNSMGGAVYDPGEYARGGYAEGGTSIADILAAQQAMYMGQGSPYGQSQKTPMGLGIPNQSIKITPLQAKPIAQPQRGPDPLSQAANFGKNLVEAKKAGQEIKSWFDKKPEDGKGGTTPATNTTTTSAPAGGKQTGLVTPTEQPTADKLAFGPEIKDPGVGLNFDQSNVASNMGGDQFASLGEDLGGADFGDLGSWFGNRGGAVPDYACGGVAGGHRDGYADKGFVTPGYDTELPATEIMDTVAEDGELSPAEIKNKQASMSPKVSGGGGGGFDVVGTAMKVLPFFLKDGGAAYREHHANPDETNDFSNVVGEKFSPEDVAAAAEEIAPTGVDPRLVALTPDQPVREMTMDPSLMFNESRGDFHAKNDAVGHGGMKGHFGRGQFGQARLQDAMNAGVLPKGTTPEQFMDSEELQKATEKWHFGDISQHISNKGLDKAIGTTINGIPVTEQGMLNVAHLGGKGGLEKFIASGGKYNPADENGTSLSDYLAMGSGVKPAAPTRTASSGYGGNSEKSASIGDVVREYAPSGMPTSENFWVPALGFLGGMLTSPNRSLAGAIGSGLVSGTSGYMELRKGQQEDIKNAFNVFKDRFEDAIDPTTKQPAKRDKFTGQLYAPDQAQSSLAKTLRGIGVDPANYGVVESNPPAAGKAGTKSDTLLPPPVKGEKPTEKVAEVVLPGEPPKPPANLPKTDMNHQQLRADAYHDWKNAGLTEDPKARLARAEAHRQDATALSQLGVSAGPRVAEANRLAEMEITNLNKELDAVADRQNSINKENDKISSVSAGEFAKEAAGRLATYERRRDQVQEINRMFSDLRGGRAAPALAEMNSWLASVGVPVDSKRASDTDYVTKLIMTKMAEDIATDKLMRAPASGMRALIQTMPNASMDPGATYTLLGQMLGEMDSVHRRDLAYKRGTDPFDFAKEWESKNGRSLNQDVATGLSQLKLHEGMSPDVIKSLYEKYGKYGYTPQGMQESQKPVAPTVAPGQQTGERKQFKQGWGVWNGSQWVPEGQ